MLQSRSKEVYMELSHRIQQAAQCPVCNVPWENKQDHAPSAETRGYRVPLETRQLLSRIENPSSVKDQKSQR